MSTPLAPPADITLPDLGIENPPKLQVLLLARRAELPAPHGTPDYRAVIARRGLLYQLVVAAATSKKRISFSQARERLLMTIFPDGELEMTSATLIAGWIKTIQEQWEILRNWLQNECRGPLPAIGAV